MEEGPDTLLFADIRTCHDGTGETRHVLSWIWSAKCIGEGDEGEDDILHVEWLKSHACVNRASEEVLHLKEKMQRVLETLHYEEDEWISQKSLRPDIPKDLEGSKIFNTRDHVLLTVRPLSPSTMFIHTGSAINHHLFFLSQSPTTTTSLISECSCFACMLVH